MDIEWKKEHGWKEMYTATSYLHVFYATFLKTYGMSVLRIKYRQHFYENRDVKDLQMAKKVTEIWLRFHKENTYGRV